MEMIVFVFDSLPLSTNIAAIGNGWGSLADQTVTAGADYTQAGALPWRWTSGGFEILLVTSRRRKRWILPKGWPQEAEHLFQAAAREAAEEAGIKGVISRCEAGRYRYDKQNAFGQDLPCQVRVFPVEVHDLASRWPERKQRRRAWMEPSEAAASVMEPELQKILGAFHPGTMGLGMAEEQASPG